MARRILRFDITLYKRAPEQVVARLNDMVNGINTSTQDALEAVYPVDSVYSTTAGAMDPAVILAFGVWEAIGTIGSAPTIYTWRRVS